MKAAIRGLRRGCRRRVAERPAPASAASPPASLLVEKNGRCKQSMRRGALTTSGAHCPLALLLLPPWPGHSFAC